MKEKKSGDNDVQGFLLQIQSGAISSFFGPSPLRRWTIVFWEKNFKPFAGVS